MNHKLKIQQDFKGCRATIMFVQHFTRLSSATFWRRWNNIRVDRYRGQ